MSITTRWMPLFTKGVIPSRANSHCDLGSSQKCAYRTSQLSICLPFSFAEFGWGLERVQKAVTVCPSDFLSFPFEKLKPSRTTGHDATERWPSRWSGIWKAGSYCSKPPKLQPSQAPAGVRKFSYLRPWVLTQTESGFLAQQPNRRFWCYYKI